MYVFLTLDDVLTDNEKSLRKKRVSRIPTHSHVRYVIDDVRIAHSIPFLNMKN